MAAEGVQFPPSLPNQWSLSHCHWEGGGLQGCALHGLLPLSPYGDILNKLSMFRVLLASLIEGGAAFRRRRESLQMPSAEGRGDFFGMPEGREHITPPIS